MSETNHRFGPCMSLVTVSAGIIVHWMIAVVCALGILLNQQGLLGTYIYRTGPNSDLYILGFCIDTLPKYCSVAAFCFVNSAMRTLNGEVLRPWITTQVQDVTKPVTQVTQAYVISGIASLYGWFDFFMYMNILLTQIDMMFIEVSADLTMTMVLTTFYVRRS
jgi:hypothetical protein